MEGLSVNAIAAGIMIAFPLVALITFVAQRAITHRVDHDDHGGPQHEHQYGNEHHEDHGDRAS